jgi:hypothetical protein
VAEVVVKIVLPQCAIIDTASADFKISQDGTMVKMIQFDNYDETTFRKTLEAFAPWKAVPAEVSVVLNGKRFVFTGDSVETYLAQINAAQAALNNVK